jgi:transcriptional regulator of acetoin/glycerol metabolism
VKSAAPVIPLWQRKRSAIIEALAETRGDVTRAARLLEIGRSSLYRSIRDLEVKPKEWRESEAA